MHFIVHMDSEVHADIDMDTEAWSDRVPALGSEVENPDPILLTGLGSPFHIVSLIYLALQQSVSLL